MLRAIVDAETGLLPRNEEGNPVFEPDHDSAPIHEETGYVLEVIDNNGQNDDGAEPPPTRVMKMFCIPRG